MRCPAATLSYKSRSSLRWTKNCTKTPVPENRGFGNDGHMQADPPAFLLLFGLQMLVQKLKSPHAVDRVRAIEEFDLSALSNSQPIVKAPHAGVFVGNPFIS